MERLEHQGHGRSQFAPQRLFGDGWTRQSVGSQKGHQKERHGHCLVIFNIKEKKHLNFILNYILPHFQLKVSSRAQIRTIYWAHVRTPILKKGQNHVLHSSESASGRTLQLHVNQRGNTCSMKLS